MEYMSWGGAWRYASLAGNNIVLSAHYAVELTARNYILVQYSIYSKILLRLSTRLAKGTTLQYVDTSVCSPEICLSSLETLLRQYLKCFLYNLPKGDFAQRY